MKLNSSDEWDSGDGAATIQWPSLRSYPPLLARHHRSSNSWLEYRARTPGALPSPMWRLLPEKLDYLFGGATGPLLTVHPLGGCPMGDDATAGVVDDCGRVFDASGSGDSAYHEGLVVLDGSIVPASLGINPALTIASLALRAIAVLRATGATRKTALREPMAIAPTSRDRVRSSRRKDTLIEVIERLSGPVAIDGMKHKGDSHVELTMRFDPVCDQGPGLRNRRRQAPSAACQRALANLCGPAARRQRSSGTRLRPGCLGGGTLRVFSHENSSPIVRKLRGWWAWLRNRGLRDSVLWTIDRFKGARAGADGRHEPFPGGDDASEEFVGVEFSGRRGASVQV